MFLPGFEWVSDMLKLDQFSISIHNGTPVAKDLGVRWLLEGLPGHHRESGDWRQVASHGVTAYV